MGSWLHAAAKANRTRTTCPLRASMDDTVRYERFPTQLVALAILLSLSTYAIGAYILAGFGLWVAILYLLYCLAIELNVVRRSCVSCYYYGKVCCFGKGKLCALMFKKKEPRTFTERKITMLDLLPDMLVGVIPILGGIVLTVKDFSWLILALTGAVVVLSFGGTAVLRGRFACKYCKQRDLGCPAQDLFEKKARTS